MGDRTWTSGSVVTALIVFALGGAAATNAALMSARQHRVLAILSGLFVLAIVAVGWSTRDGRRDPLILLFCCYSTFVAATRVLLYLQDGRNLYAALFTTITLALFACSVNLWLELLRRRASKPLSESRS